MTVTDKITRAELAEDVRNLHAEVAALRNELAAHHCHGCTCPGWIHYYYPAAPQPLPWVTPYVVTTGALSIVSTTPLTSVAPPVTSTTWTVN
jgi:hypothetical protein